MATPTTATQATNGRRLRDFTDKVGATVVAAIIVATVLGVANLYVEVSIIKDHQREMETIDASLSEVREELAGMRVEIRQLREQLRP